MSVAQYIKDIMNWSCTDDPSKMVIKIHVLITVRKWTSATCLHALLNTDTTL